MAPDDEAEPGDASDRVNHWLVAENGLARKAGQNIADMPIAGRIMMYTAGWL